MSDTATAWLVAAAIVFGPSVTLVVACLVHDWRMALRERRADRAAWREIQSLSSHRPL